VQHQRRAIGQPPVGDDAHVQQAVAVELPGDDVAGRIVGGGGRDRLLPALPFEPAHQVRHTAMIDVAVRP